VETLMDGNKADMVFTDPPYGMKKEAEGVLNDNLNFDDLLDFNKKWIPLTFELLKDTGSWYCWGIDEPLMDIYSHILKPMQKDNKITFRNLITWDKGHTQGQLSPDFRMYPVADEKCLFVMCGVQGFANNKDQYFEGFEPIRLYLCEQKKIIGWNDDDIQRITGVTTVARHCFGKSQWEFPTEEHYNEMREAANGNAFKREYDEIKREYDEIKREYYATRAYFNNTHDNMNNVWHFDKTSGEERESAGGHATPKPIALCSRAIKSSSRENEIVLDMFGGSGSTLIACEQLNRNAYVMELEPQWVDVIINRWETFTGQKAVKL
jgi:DNA modification methylase